MGVAANIQQGRAAYVARGFEDAYRCLSAADAVEALPAEDLELVAEAAFLTGREEQSVDLWTRAYQQHLNDEDPERAAASAYWLAFHLANRGELAPASGWAARGMKLLDDGRDCAERGYLMMIAAIQAVWRGDLDDAEATITIASDIATRFGDADLVTLTTLARAQVLLARGRTADGIALLDDVMMAVTTGEVSVTVAGLAYCAVISSCREVFDVRRAREWSAALTHWCDAQPDLVPYTGWCLIHRAEIMQVQGEWDDAAEAALHAYERSQLSTDHATAAEAHYLLADLHRLRGDLTSAEAAYTEASRSGREPQPGLALLRLAQGQPELAAAAIRRVVEERQLHGVHRAGVLAADVEIMLAVGDVRAARRSGEELTALATQFESPLLAAIAAQWIGAVLLAEGDPRGATAALRRGWAGWQQLDGPYEAARCRELIGLCCRARGDEDSARMELDAARWAYLQLGAAVDQGRVDRLLAQAAGEPTCGLTGREVEVLRLVAAGKTNRSIAADLFLSEKTVARHLSNIFGKLAVPSRAAATAFAYEHQLV